MPWQQSGLLSWPQPRLRFRAEQRRDAAFVACAALLAAASLLAIAPIARHLLALWSTDPLRSIGMLFPLVSFALTMRAWRELGWETEGTPWGLGLMGAAAAIGYASQRFELNISSSHFVLVLLPHDALTVFAFGSGLVLAAGGPRLWRAAAPPLLLLLFVNPFPTQFSSLYDLPLQRISAHIAWLFARAIGQQPGQDQLRLMFSPDFGMFIAPGCNGIRGSLTMGYMALILGYANRFRRRTLALSVVAAVALGYLFNLARLCVLVLFYRLAMRFPSLQERATAADYLIGSCLFFTAMALFATGLRMGRREGIAGDGASIGSGAVGAGWQAAGFRWRTAAIAGFALGGLLAYPRSFARVDAADAPAPPFVASDLPDNFPYAVSRIWNERYLGRVYYDWVDYLPTAPAQGFEAAAGADGSMVHVGVGLDSEWHDTLGCHLNRDEYPSWTGTTRATTADGNPVSFHTTFYDNGVTRLLEANSSCDAAGCAQTEHSAGPFLLELTPVRPPPLSKERIFPVLIRIESTDTASPAEAVRGRLLADLRAFVERADLSTLNRATRVGTAIAER